MKLGDSGGICACGAEDVLKLGGFVWVMDCRIWRQYWGYTSRGGMIAWNGKSVGCFQSLEPRLSMSKCRSAGGGSGKSFA